MELPGHKDTVAWRAIEHETPVFWNLLVDPKNNFACPRCDHSVFSPKEHHDCENAVIQDLLAGIGLMGQEIPIRVTPATYTLVGRAHPFGSEPSLASLGH